ncbi:hypothetical protein DNTS_032489, partial [Danionella cerebrum]
MLWRRLEALVQEALGEGDPAVTEAVCVCLWNACLPLLQHKLCKRVRKPLLTLTRALEHTDSLLLDIRCWAQAELFSLENQVGRLESAASHLHKALALDSNCERLQWNLHLLNLRCSSINEKQMHGRTEDMAALLIMQAKDGSRGVSVMNYRHLLVQAGVTLAPEVFQSVLDAHHRIAEAGAQDEDFSLLAAKVQKHVECVKSIEDHLTTLCCDHKERVRLWASLVKASHQLEVFDVCIAACRFCLLYDDRRWKIT